MIRVVNIIPRARVMLLEIWATVAARRIWTGASFRPCRAEAEPIVPHLEGERCWELGKKGVLIPGFGG